MTRELDIILFGATGYTGKNAIPIIAKLSKANNRQLTWGVAGRSEDKLKEVLAAYEAKLCTSLSSIPVITADVSDEKSLTEMARRARIIINCVGPYRFYGEPVVKACVEEGTHHVDVSGEPQFIEKMAVKYHKAAEEKGIYIISACGFDSIPADLGVIFLQEKFNGTVNSVETYLEAWEEDGSFSGAALNYGTWESAVYGLAHGEELKPLRKELYANRLPSFKPKLQARTWPHKNSLVEGWILPFLGSDRAVIRRSQRLIYESEKQRPVQVETYFLVKSLFGVILFSLFGTIFSILTKFQFGRTLLLKYPEFFSAGMFSKNPPSEEKVNKAWFSVTIYGEGWKEPLSSADDEYSTPVDRAVCVKVKGQNPGYGSTNKCLVLAAIKVITETDKLPGDGGVLPPGYAFKNSSLIEELNQNEVTFEVLFEKDLESKN